MFNKEDYTELIRLLSILKFNIDKYRVDTNYEDTDLIDAINKLMFDIPILEID